MAVTQTSSSDAALWQVPSVSGQTCEAVTGRPDDANLCESTTDISVPREITQTARQSVASDQNGWISHIRDVFYSEPEVQSLYVTFEEADVDIWLVIPQRNFTVLRRLIGMEMGVLRRFKGEENPPFLLEFHIVYRGNTDESQLIPREAIRIPR